jgi:hypothetical protein
LTGQPCPWTVLITKRSVVQVRAAQPDIDPVQRRYRRGAFCRYHKASCPLACPLPAPMTRYGDRMHGPASVVAGTVEAIWSPTIGPGELDTRPVAGAVVEALHEGNVVAAATTDDAGR